MCICVYTCVCLCMCFCMCVRVCTTAFMQVKGQLHGTRSFLYTGPRDQSPAVRYSGNCLSLTDLANSMPTLCTRSLHVSLGMGSTQSLVKNCP